MMLFSSVILCWFAFISAPFCVSVEVQSKIYYVAYQDKIVSVYNTNPLTLRNVHYCSSMCLSDSMCSIFFFNTQTQACRLIKIFEIPTLFDNFIILGENGWKCYEPVPTEITYNLVTPFPSNDIPSMYHYAMSSCTSTGGYLARLTSKEAHTKIKAYLDGSHSHNLKFILIDGRKIGSQWYYFTGQDFLYTPWNSQDSQPDLKASEVNIAMNVEHSYSIHDIGDNFTHYVRTGTMAYNTAGFLCEYWH